LDQGILIVVIIRFRESTRSSTASLQGPSSARDKQKETGLSIRMAGCWSYSDMSKQEYQTLSQRSVSCSTYSLRKNRYQLLKKPDAYFALPGK
jgi:hypothetical protein